MKRAIPKGDAPLVGLCAVVAALACCLVGSACRPRPGQPTLFGRAAGRGGGHRNLFRRLGTPKSRPRGGCARTRTRTRTRALFKDFVATLNTHTSGRDAASTSASTSPPPSASIAPDASASALQLTSGDAPGCLWRDGRVQAPEKFPVILVLPGFGNDQNDYVEMLGSQISLTGALSARGFRATVLPIERVEWFNVARGMLSPDFWTSKSLPNGPSYSWYIQRINDTVTEILKNVEEEHVVLVAHSAGGWLARAYLAEGEDHRIRALVTLGTPHRNEGGTDVTRGVLPHLNERYPGAFHEGVRYISVAGNAIQGAKDGNVRKSAKAAFAAYRQVCGVGSSRGDGVVPLQCAHLDGATQLTLNGVWHSIDKPELWYGSDGIVDRWLWCLCEDCDDEACQEPPQSWDLL